MTEPTMRELLKAVEQATEQQRALVGRFDALLDRLDRDYVRKDVYAALRSADQAMVADVASDVRELKSERGTEQGFRRQVLLGFALTALTVVTTIAIAVASAVGG